MTDKFDKQTRESYRQAFALFDKDGSGSISLSEIGTVLSSLGHTPTQEELKDLLGDLDSDGNGEISFEEFLEMMSRKAPAGSEEEELRTAFQAFDQNGDGYISELELRDLLLTLGENVTDAEVKRILKQADQDGDGRINFAEFCKMMGK
eukprot:TRINITY_DN2016_c0_g1_i1.p1 TRINITY_DN2016_c0_g1~~TRINITY_DN2016_c0_g1_i1.p1  ORF type:complete len:149 (-),score=44.36 TRINITY_DN2016_c0_g1_i1:269-715(-)